MRIEIIDSHTGGEPTRVVLSGLPELVGDSLAEKRAWFSSNGRRFWEAMTKEPRGTDIIVGAVLEPPTQPGSVGGVVFFNNVGVLGMCGHGTIGVVETLRWMGKMEVGRGILETPVGDVGVELHEDGSVSVANVLSRFLRTIEGLEVEGLGVVSGDVAYGGNWFFICEDHGLEIGMGNLSRLTEASEAIKAALQKEGITGDDGGEIDHIELVGPSEVADAKNFVLCPGNAYDRSPCGTGTSAKLACLVAHGKIEFGEVWRQESVTGSVFEGVALEGEGGVWPTIRGRAWVTATSTLVLEESDPLRWGIPG